jgi:hypothetical protein
MLMCDLAREEVWSVCQVKESHVQVSQELQGVLCRWQSRRVREQQGRVMGNTHVCSQKAPGEGCRDRF